jgi:hypothetical protein
VDEFLAHPDFRQIAAFFLGWVFISSLNHIISSVSVRRGFWRCCSFIFRSSYSDSISLSSGDETPTLSLTLSLCLAFASAAYLASLLTFRPGQGCSFSVAWGGVSAQCARLVGLIILILELRQLGLPRWESALFWTWLFIGSVFVFLTNAVTIGVTRSVQQLNVSLCYKTHFFPASLVSSLIYLSMEVYIAARAMSLIAPPFLKVQHRLGGFQDTRVLRAISLIVLELLILVSAPRAAGILNDFVPFSIGSVLVLVAFNYHVTEPEALDFIPSSCPSRRSRRSGHPSLVISIDSHFPGHSFAARSPGDPTLENGERCSVRTTNSHSEYTRSVVVPRVASWRSLRSGGMPSPPLSAPQANDVKRREMREISQLQVSHQILPSQVSYAKRFEGEVEHNDGGLSARPRVVIPTDAPQQSSQPASGYCKSPGSAFYGSDIIRMDSNRHIIDKTKRHTPAPPSTYYSEVSYSPRESLSSPPTPSFERYSFASLSAPLAPPNEDLSGTHEDLFVVKSSTFKQSRKTMRWSTFDEQHFRRVTMPSRPVSGPLPLPPLPSGRRRLRGPRPPRATERSPLMPQLP